MTVSISQPDHGEQRATRARLRELKTALASLPPELRRQQELLLDELLARTPFSPLLQLDNSALCALVAELLALMAGRRAPVAAACRRLPGELGQLLISNCADVPFLLDSLCLYLRRQEIGHRIVAHPILGVERQGGRLSRLDAQTSSGARESLILIWLEEGAPPSRRLTAGVEKVLGQALRVEAEQQALWAGLSRLAGLPELARERDFLEWLGAGNYHLFGYRALPARGLAAPGARLPELGLCAPDLTGSPLQRPEQQRRELRWARGAQRLSVETAPLASPLHRDQELTCLVVREGAEPGGVTHCFYGLFTAHASDQAIDDVPALRGKIAAALARLGIAAESFDGRTSLKLFNTFPKVELFLLSEADLERIIRSFIALQREERVRIIPMAHLSRERLSLLLVLPAAFHSPEGTARLAALLERRLGGTAPAIGVMHEYGGFLGLLVTFASGRRRPRLDLLRLEATLSRILRPWESKLRAGLDLRLGRRLGREVAREFRTAFDAEYRHLVHPRYAVRDILNLRRLWREEAAFFDLWGPLPGSPRRYLLQFYQRSEALLNELMPLLENLGLLVIEEVDFSVRQGGRAAFIKSFVVQARPGALPLLAIRDRLLEALAVLWRQEIDNDPLNRLLTVTGLGWREIDVFRGYRNYLFQLGTSFARHRVELALVHNPEAALLLFRYFAARFRPDPAWSDPLVREEEALSPLRLALATALEAVADVGEDRILRTLFNLIDSTVRTSFFQEEAARLKLFAFKISALGIIEMPIPRPLFEIYLHAPGVEGIHLRGGRVARGGIRWSDRPDDFRTEILGLMKTQMTKNAVIVPVGAKGGFVLTGPERPHEERSRLARDAYRLFMQALLALTDNLVGGRVVRPAGIVAYDGDDPYLVVAADKGTAQFSDVANAVSVENGFWLGDAFASGGSRGYDHKRLGITARGAWEGVKRHFRELGRDIQREPFTVVGIGDMSGDVFGNGMLLSRQIRLLGAFDHRHIFLDPAPDPERSWLERKRLFDLPRSAWSDYDPALISAGGGVWPRDSKEIPLSAAVRDWLGVRQSSIDGEGLIRLLLGAPVDLLWNGGIGTYVKAQAEKHEEVRDRGNDGVRVDATRVRAKVVGEGGNLGLTQRARIEYALQGGCLNTDAIDNSAGVDTSDHEVNLKILMQQLQESGTISGPAERDMLLEGVTDEVCAMVLRNNISQTLALSLDRRRCREEAAPYLEQIDHLVNAGLLDRAGEGLPTRKEVLARGGEGLTRPELAILLAYSKMALHAALLESESFAAADSGFLAAYFPEPLRRRFAGAIERHPLRREIGATVVTNYLVDRTGAPCISSLAQETATPVAEVVRSLLLFDRVLQAEPLRVAIQTLDNRMPAGLQLDLLLQLEEGLAAAARFALRQPQRLPLDAAAEEALGLQYDRFRAGLAALLSDREWSAVQARAGELGSHGLAPERALQAAILPHLPAFLPLLAVAEQCGTDLLTAGRVLSDLDKSLGLESLRQGLQGIPVRDGWDRLALTATRERLAAVARALTVAILGETDGNVEAYLSRRRRRLRSCQSLVADLRGRALVNLHPYTVLIQTLEELLAAPAGESRSESA